jgi:hypothetical protein
MPIALRRSRGHVHRWLLRLPVTAANRTADHAQKISTTSGISEIGSASEKA